MILTVESVKEPGQQNGALSTSAMEQRCHRRVLAGLRPSGSAVATSPARLHLSLLHDLQRVVDLDAKVSDRALSELI